MEEKYFVHPSSFVDEDVEIGEGTKIWHFCHIQKGARIGKRCSLGQNVNVSNHVKVGDGCKLQNNVSLYEGVELEDYVFCGPSCVFTNDLTPGPSIPRAAPGIIRLSLRRVHPSVPMPPLSAAIPWAAGPSSGLAPWWPAMCPIMR